MTYEEAKDYLSQGIALQDLITAKEDRIESWRQIAESITANPENSSGGSGYVQSKLENCAVEIDALEREIKEAKRLLPQVLAEIRQVIFENVADEVDKQVLILRYLAGESLGSISEQLHYAYRWVARRHKRAVMQIADHLDQAAR